MAVFYFEMIITKMGLAVSICLFFIGVSKGQESVTQETSPASMKWYQINTHHFRILYPYGFEKEAERVANTLEHIREPEAASLEVMPKKISVILHSQSAISNGFVTLAPRRSEFYAMPPQNYNFIGTNEWLTLLSSHEYRHVVQFQKSLTGFNKGIHLLFGQLAQASMAFVAVPQWFWEGDAVATETAFTSSGRGRIPEFDMLLRTNLLEGRNFNYHKQYLRSYKNNVPDHYVLGYHMVSYLRKKTGNPQVWSDITKRAWSIPFIPFTFSNAIKKETGMYVTDLYKEMALDLKKNWKEQQDALALTQFEKINKRPTKVYTDYLYPQPLSNGKIVALKTGIGDFSQLVTLTEGGAEKKQFVPGPINDAGMLSVAADRAVWNEYRFDPRWRTRSYSIIKGFDFNTGKSKVIAKHERYGAAALSSDGNRVATVQVDESYQNNLMILDYNTGAVVKKIENQDNHILTMPRWSHDGKQIVYIQLSNDGKQIMAFDVASSVIKPLYQAGDENVGHPVLFDNFLIFNSSYSGIDNIYALDIATQKRYQITSGKYGAFNPSISEDGKTMYYNEQTKDGFDVVKIPFDPEKWTAIEAVAVQPSLFANMLSEQEGQPTLMESIPTIEYERKRYHRASGMMNLHSWGPYFTNSIYQANLGITSKDILSTTEISGGYTYDINEKTGAWGAGISYQGMYPIIDGNFSYAKRSNSDAIFGRDVEFKWTEIGGAIGIRVPLILTSSKYNTSLSVGNSVGYTQVSGFKNAVSENGVVISSGFGRLVPANDSLAYNFTDKASNGDLLYNQFSFSFINLLKRSRRDFNSKYGQSLAFEAYNTPYGGDFVGHLYVARGAFYFPGLLKHHSLYFRGGYQQRLSDLNFDTYTFRNKLAKPRGYSYPQDSRFYSISTNYALPLWYPDISIGPILNIQRIKANLFYDYGNGEGHQYFYRFESGQPTTVYSINNADVYQSFGAEITFDINIMRFLPQFELGLRSSYTKANRFNEGGAVFEFILGNIPF
ncbi:MAG: PD40 domain-containing protein [Cyclobacteriaceae bacterium]|nr:PD40 domain-containing protein [Cyclobacteriaceae bacterium]